MSREPEPIIDHYGTEVTVEWLMGSTGPVVDLNTERTVTQHVPAGVAERQEEDFHRFTPEQADDLADRLKAAAKEARGE